MADEIANVDKRMRSDRSYAATAQCLPLFLADAIPGARYKLQAGADVFQEVGTGTGAFRADRARELLHRMSELPKLDQLPKLLRFYADYFEAVSKLTPHHASKAPPLLKAMMPLELIEAVKTVTGKPHWNEIATLLTAAYQAGGCDVTVDPRSFKMQYRRRSNKK